MTLLLHFNLEMNVTVFAALEDISVLVMEIISHLNFLKVDCYLNELLQRPILTVGPICLQKEKSEEKEGRHHRKHKRRRSPSP